MKIGILTLYKDSVNFGGLLQAKAMTEVLMQMGHKADQITLGDFTREFKSRSTIDKIREHGVSYAFELLRMKYQNAGGENYADASRSIALCDDFRRSIPHTKAVNEDDLPELDRIYDCFITGSDQVWNPKWMRKVYLLNFTQKRKLAYAASMARFDFTKFETKMMQDTLPSFHWISVREKQAVEFLSDRCHLKADYVLDPTMLLSKEQWCESESPVKIDGRYILCYFLHQSEEKRQYAQRMAKRYNLEIIYPIQNGFLGNWENESSGEKMLYDVGPAEFLYLIHHAEHVLTDSFHGTVFSIIYEKPFTHLLRERSSFKGNMNSRVFSLLNLFGLEKQMKDCNADVEWNQIHYDEVFKILDTKREYCKAQLQKAIEE